MLGEFDGAVVVEVVGRGWGIAFAACYKIPIKADLF